MMAYAAAIPRSSSKSGGPQGGTAMLTRLKYRFGLAALAVFLVTSLLTAGAIAQKPDQADDSSNEGSAADTVAASTTGTADRGQVSSQDEREGEADSGEPESEYRVLRAYICRGIEESEPTEAGKSFIPTPDGVLHLWCFSEIGGPARTDTILHVWYWGDREMARVPLEVKGPRWRTWSTKQIPDEWSGDWHVDIADRSGVVLSRLDFSVESERR
jgi:hypothetical protein